MQNKQTILVVASLLVVVLSVTLAYFTAQIIGKGKDVSVSSADLKIIFTDSDGSISGTNIEPGWSDTKTFTAPFLCAGFLPAVWAYGLWVPLPGFAGRR